MCTRHTHNDAHACTDVSSRALSLRQQFGADLLISIATLTAVGDGDIMKIDCHKKNKKQEYSRKRATVMEVLAKVQQRSSLLDGAVASSWRSSLVNEEQTCVRGLRSPNACQQ